MAEPVDESELKVARAPESGVFKRVMVEHGEMFALVKRLAMSSAELDREARGELRSRELAEITNLCSALREIVDSRGEAGLLNGELVEAIAALDAINPGSPEWGPALLQLSELVEAQAEGEIPAFVAPSNRERMQTAS